ncbi:MAG: DUF115 domain-containing protein [Spirochaetaceae bacterium]|jgi:hypothetical protein|nr:DUF115 domain-containing protein [Spirochaetaceae bacterium]
MDKQTFERNVLALSENDPLLCARLSSALTTMGMYRFIESRSGEVIPALTGTGGAAHPLHSTVDPRREGVRLISTLAEEGFIVFLGLGGGFEAEAALEREKTKKVLVIEYDCNGIAELLSSRNYISLFRNPRFRLLADPCAEEIEEILLNSYIPAIDGGIRVFPLRTRAGSDPRFNDAADAVKRAIDSVSKDYSVQAYFGKRWFSNIIRNLSLAEKPCAGVPPVRKAIVCAAGPSLDEQIPLIKKELDQKEMPFLIAADTSFPALLRRGIEPDAVISIDCQHISYRHFFDPLPKTTRLFLDLASPPPVAARTENRFFFSGGHPLGLYISRVWRAMPVLDTSGANVTYAALSLAENLGAKSVLLYGADFSYPFGKTYARGCYIYPYFEKLQSRYEPLEALHSAFLYRDSSLQKCALGNNTWYYETQTLKYYREKARQKEETIHSAKAGRNLTLFSSGPVRQSADAFLKSYRESVESLTSFDFQCGNETGGETEIAATLLPLAAFIRRTNPALGPAEFFNAVLSCCTEEFIKVIPN